jgi:hypothetical protein
MLFHARAFIETAGKLPHIQPFGNFPWGKKILS